SLRIRSLSFWKRCSSRSWSAVRITCGCPAREVDEDDGAAESVRLACSASSLCSVCASCASSSFCSARKRSSAVARNASTRSNGRRKLALPRTLIRSLLPARLSIAFQTKSPLLAQADAVRWPRKLSQRTHRKSDSMSASATTIRFNGLLEAVSDASPAAGGAPAGGPFGNAVLDRKSTRL